MNWYDSVASDWHYGALSWNPSRASTSATWVRNRAHASHRPTTVQQPAYDYAWEDLRELQEMAGAWDEEGLAPSQEALVWAGAVLSRTMGAFPPPEVTSRESGTVLLLWRMTTGFLSIEIGAEQFGLIGYREGYPSLRSNGRTNELLSYVPKRQVSAAETALPPRSNASGKSVSNGLRTLMSSLTPTLSDFRGPIARVSAS